jgi:hypothetical protein
MNGSPKTSIPCAQVFFTCLECRGRPNYELNLNRCRSHRHNGSLRFTALLAHVLAEQTVDVRDARHTIRDGQDAAISIRDNRRWKRWLVEPR